MSNLAVKEVEFNGDTLIAVQNNETEKVYVGVRWVCEGIGLTTDQAKRQLKNIREDLVVSKGVSNLTLPTNGGIQEVLCIELDYLPIWLAKISITPKMQEEKPEVVTNLVNYQLKAKEVLANAFVRGVTQIVPKTYKEALIALVESIEIQEQQQILIEEQKPKVESFEMFINAEGNQKMNQVAKSLGIGRNKLFELLRNMKVLTNDNLPYQRFIDSGYFVVKENTIVRDGFSKPYAQTYVTPKGVDYIGKKLKEAQLTK